VAFAIGFGLFLLLMAVLAVFVLRFAIQEGRRRPTVAPGLRDQRGDEPGGLGKGGAGISSDEPAAPALEGDANEGRDREEQADSERPSAEDESQADESDT